jgi:hypothetical protein
MFLSLVVSLNASDWRKDYQKDHGPFEREPPTLLRYSNSGGPQPSALFAGSNFERSGV